MLTLEKLLRMYEMPPGRGGQSGNRGGGSSSRGSGGGGASDNKSKSRGSVSGATRGNIGAKTSGNSKSGNSNQGTRGGTSGATQGNISAKTNKSGNNNQGTRGGTYSGPKGTPTGGLNQAAKDAHKNASVTYGADAPAAKDTDSYKFNNVKDDEDDLVTGPPIGTNLAAQNVDKISDSQMASALGMTDSEYAAHKAANVAMNKDLDTTKVAGKPSTITIDGRNYISLTSKAAPDIMGPPSSLSNANSPKSGATRGNISAKVNLNGDTFADTTAGGVLTKIGDGFRQIAIDTFGAEPGIEGYDEDGNYGFGYNSPYGQQLLDGNPNVRAMGDLSIDQQKAKAADYTPPEPLLSGVFDDFFDIDIDTDSWFSKIAKSLTSLVFGNFGATIGKAFGPYGAIAGLILGKFFGGKFHDYFADRDVTAPKTYSGPKGVPHLGLNKAAYNAYLNAQGLYGGGGAGDKGTDYQARLNDPDTRGGAGETPPIVPKDKVLAIGDTKGDGALVDDGDGDGKPVITVKPLNTLLDELEKDYSAERDQVKTEQRQGRVLDRIVAARQPIGTFNNLVY